MVKEAIKSNEEVTLTVGVFTFSTEDNHVHVHNNKSKYPNYIRTVSYDNADDAYTGAWRMANLQNRA